MTHPLFVYGSLRKDVKNSMFHLLARHARFVGYAQVQGKLYDLGECPGIVLSIEDDRWVRGEVYLLDERFDILTSLDEYEGCGPADPDPHEFERVAYLAKFDNGTTAQVWIYVYKFPTNEKPEISSGDYFHDAL